MDQKPKRERDEGLDSQYADDMLEMDVVSAQTVTGMVPTPPLDEGMAEGYRTLFPVTQPISQSAQRADTPEEQKRRSQEPPKAKKEDSY